MDVFFVGFVSAPSLRKQESLLTVTMGHTISGRGSPTNKPSPLRSCRGYRVPTTYSPPRTPRRLLSACPSSSPQAPSRVDFRVVIALMAFFSLPVCRGLEEPSNLARGMLPADSRMFTDGRGDITSVPLVSERQETERGQAGVDTEDRPGRNANSPVKLTTGRFVLREGAPERLKQEQEAEETRQSHAAALPGGMMPRDPRWGKAAAQTGYWFLPWTDRDDVGGRAFIGEAGIRHQSGSHAVHVGLESQGWGSPPEAAGFRGGPGLSDREDSLSQLGSTSETPTDFKKNTTAEPFLEWNPYDALSLKRERNARDGGSEEGIPTVPRERTPRAVLFPSETSSSFPSRRFLMKAFSSEPYLSPASAPDFSASAPTRPSGASMNTALPEALLSRVSAASSLLAGGPQAPLVNSQSSSSSPQPSIAGLQSSFFNKLPPLSSDVHAPLSVNASPSPQGSPISAAVPAAVPFIIGIVLSLVGTLLSALGDVCIRYSFVRTQAFSSSTVSSSPPSNVETPPLVQRPGSPTRLPGAPNSTVTRFPFSTGGTASGSRDSELAAAASFLPCPPLTSDRAPVDNDTFVALSLLPANVTGFAALQIFFVVILAWFMLGEVVDRVNLAGGILVLAGLITLTACASPEPPLPDSSTLARQLVVPSALVFEVVCLSIVLAGLCLLLTYHPQKNQRGDSGTTAASAGSVVHTAPSGSLLTAAGNSSAVSPAQELRRPIISTTEEEQQERGVGGRTLDDQKISPVPPLDVDETGQFAALVDSDDEAEESRSGVRSTATCFRATLHVWHHILLPATAGVLGAVASISIKLIQAFLFSLATVCLSSSGGFLSSTVVSPSSSLLPISNVLDLLSCLINPVFLFYHPQLPLLFLLLVTAALLELLFLSQTLRHYPASESVPLMNATLTVTTGVGGVILFNEPPANVLGWTLGLVLLVVGIAILGFGGRMWRSVRKAARAGGRAWRIYMASGPTEIDRGLESSHRTNASGRYGFSWITGHFGRSTAVSSDAAANRAPPRHISTEASHASASVLFYTRGTPREEDVTVEAGGGVRKFPSLSKWLKKSDRAEEMTCAGGASREESRFPGTLERRRPSNEFREQELGDRRAPRRDHGRDSTQHPLLGQSDRPIAIRGRGDEPYPASFFLTSKLRVKGVGLPETLCSKHSSCRNVH
ncbi:magnesium transporter nipa [Cystoisospora suis]|uniref:Magnesium transporter nipa n=1 Tax=Cystoisospora suis TaxID=483139 RepID=A0A2C6KGT8_9APIC|nr:magnesium transporter nipa [Cystoisospora suis]